MPDYTPRNGIFFPLPTDNIKHNSVPALLADHLKHVAFTADQAVERAGARNSQRVLDELEQVETRVQDNTSLAQQAHQRVDALGGRVGDLETATGVAPGDPTDAALNLILSNLSSTSRGTLNDLYASRADVGIRPESYGAVGDGTHDDTEAFEAALIEATASVFNQPPIILDGGREYRITRPLRTAAQNVTIIGVGTTPSVIHASAHDNDPLGFEAGAPYHATQLSSSMTIGTNQWTLDNASGVTAGSLMEVRSSKSWYFDPRPEGTDARKAELHLVEKVEGNTVWTRDVANDGYNLASETVDVTFRQPISVHLENLTLKGIKDPVGTNTTGRTGIFIEGALFPVLRRVSVEGLPYTGIRVSHSYRPVIEGGHVFDANGTSTGYGLQFMGCRNGQASGMLFAGCRRGVDVSGLNIPSIDTLIENCMNLGGGTRADGTPYGWETNGNAGAVNYGFGSHGPADRTTYRGCHTSNVHIPYSLRGGNETIDQATHFGRTRGGFIQLIDGENLIATNIRLYAPEQGGAKETEVFDGGSSIRSRRPDYFLRVRDTYKHATSRVYIENVDADVQEAFAYFDNGALLTNEAHFSNIRVVFATLSGSTECAFFHHDGPLTPTGSRWTVSLLHRRRQGGSTGHRLTRNVNIQGAKYLEFGLAGATS